jgi:PIN domain nuclease of toxin-antitoxin system
MNALLDTHTFLWWVADAPQLSETARSFIANPDNKIFFSVASGWEIIIKVGTGKLILRLFFLKNQIFILPLG